MRSLFAVFLLLSLTTAAQESVERSAADPEAFHKPTDAARIERLKRARGAMKKNVEADPENFQLWLHLGFIEHKLGDLEAAQAAFEKVVSLEPSETAAHYMLALIYEKKGQNDKAIAAWQACVAHSKDPNLLAIANKHLKDLKP